MSVVARIEAIIVDTLDESLLAGVHRRQDAATLADALVLLETEVLRATLAEAIWQRSQAFWRNEVNHEAQTAPRL